ncbi:MAG TPA: uroporphyrinogen-III synthase [Terriglobales bacterium]|nr:uroporphyrinogen-III synthase [Terriglobales bacterium]
MRSIPGGLEISDEMHGRREGFRGLRVLALESRRAREMAQLIEKHGGHPFVAPATQEVATDSSAEALNFTSDLLEGRFSAVIFLTGVGTRILAQHAQRVCPREQFVAALSGTLVVARGPKPAAALRELGVPVTLTVPEPNTWREILQTLDQNRDLVPLRNRRVAVQEYGVSSSDLLHGLSERGAEVVAVRVYQWALPDDVAPLEAAVQALLRHEIDVVLFTASVQFQHLLQIADRTNLRPEVIAALAQTLVGSIGPVTSSELRRHGIAVDVEPIHPKMGFLVKEIAERIPELLLRKRQSTSLGR